MASFTDFIKDIDNRINKLTTLEIKTIVGDYLVNYDASIMPKTDGSFSVIMSQINLLEGDVTTHFSNELLEDKFEWLRNFHAQREEKGHEIINNNVRAIISLFDLYRRTRSENKEVSGMP